MTKYTRKHDVPARSAALSSFVSQRFCAFSPFFLTNFWFIFVLFLRLLLTRARQPNEHVSAHPYTERNNNDRIYQSLYEMKFVYAQRINNKYKINVYYVCLSLDRVFNS